MNIRAFQAEKVLRPRGSTPLAVDFGVPLDLEIGCGVGWHPVQYARENPSRFLIAIEHTREKFQKFENRFHKNGRPPNLLPVHADAVAWVTHCLKPGSVSRCFILYPNPNPKNSSKRWIRMPFMAKLLEVLRSDGEIIFATNILSYSREILEWSKEWDLKAESRTPTQARTHFEKKYLERGETCYEIRLTRKPSPSQLQLK